MPACIRLDTVKCKIVEKLIHKKQKKKKKKKKRKKNDTYIYNFSLKLLVTLPVFMTSFADIHVQKCYQIFQ